MMTLYCLVNLSNSMLCKHLAIEDCLNALSQQDHGITWHRRFALSIPHYFPSKAWYLQAL